MSSCPQVSRGWLAGRPALSGWRVQWLRTATSARQSATRPGLAAGLDTKVPLEQSAGSRSGKVGLFWAGEGRAKSAASPAAVRAEAIGRRVLLMGAVPRLAAALPVYRHGMGGVAG